MPNCLPDFLVDLDTSRFGEMFFVVPKNVASVVGILVTVRVPKTLFHRAVNRIVLSDLPKRVYDFAIA